MKKNLKLSKNAILIKDGSQFLFVENKILDSLPESEILSLAISTLDELRRILVDESLQNIILTIDNQSLVDSLNNTLSQIKKKHPSIAKAAHAMDTNFSLKVFRA